MTDEFYAYALFRVNDLYLVPVCLLVLYLFAIMMRRKYRSSVLGPYIFPALTLRFIAAIVYTYVTAYYYGFGDSITYYQGVLDLHKAYSTNPDILASVYSKIELSRTDPIYPFFMYDGNGAMQYYMLDPRTYTVPRVALPFSLLFNKSFLCISFCISYFAFLGSWRILKMFYEIYPHLHKKLAIVILFLPSTLFWGVSLLKDPICLAAMGFFIYAAYSLLIKKRKITGSILTIIISGFLLLNLKAYILICITGVFLLWVFLRFRGSIKEPVLRNVSTVLFGVIALVAGYLAVNQLATEAAASKYSADQILTTIESTHRTFSNNAVSFEEGGRSNFSVGTTNNSTLGAVLLLPLGVINTYLRPFPWDIRSPIMILSMLESLAFLILTIKCLTKVGVGKTFSYIFSNPLITFCFVFAIVFGGIIGITTTNFGALVRYKIPSMPFYAVTFILVMDKSGKFSPKYIFSKRLF
jgi:hypothetical protein